MGEPTTIKTVTLTSDNLRSVNVFPERNRNNTSYTGHSIPSNYTQIIPKYFKNQVQNASIENETFLQLSVNSNNSKDHTFKETSVINENNTNKFFNMTDNQMNANFLTDFNGTDINITYSENVTRYEQSWLLNSEQISVPEKDGLTGKMSIWEIIGIFCCCLLIVAIFCSLGYFLYNNRGFNRPEVLNDHCSNPDSSGYLDDTSVRVRNDSFLLLHFNFFWEFMIHFLFAS